MMMNNQAAVVVAVANLSRVFLLEAQEEVVQILKQVAAPMKVILVRQDHLW